MSLLRMEEQSLIVQLQRGETGAAEALVQQYQDFVFAVAMKTLGNYHDAEEVAMDALVKALQKIESYRGDAPFKSWLYRIVYNTCMNRLRKRSKSTSLDDSPMELEAGPEREAEEVEDREEMLRQAVAELPPSDRLMITMYYYDKSSVQDIADATGMTLSNAKVKLHRIRSKLKEQLAPKLWTV